MPFHGYLDRWEFQGSTLEVRFSSGNFEDVPRDAVLYVTVEAPSDRSIVGDRLDEIEPHETEILVLDPSATEVVVEFNYADPLVLRGKEVRVRRADFEAEDYARLARLHHQSADLAGAALAGLDQRVSTAKHLLEEQARRITEKVKGHKVGSTARTLYDQQLSFISRVLHKLENQ